tara:strand:+ start:49 stop:324 length:276 start_codon:yes stop_codon:yes gene_type:complete
MASKWVHYNLNCVVCGIKVGATVRKRHEPEVEHLCFDCPEPKEPEPKAKPTPRAKPASYGSVIPNIRMNGDIAQSMCDDMVDEMILGWEGK